uniref:GED domain-containing protein n=1 Tax=Panagrellus redivivus TaxID=6233 RepID=A0A7E4UML8_PANRE
MTANNGGKTTVEDVKAKILGQLDNIKESDRTNFLVNKLVQFELDAAKAKAENTQLAMQTKRAGLLEKKVTALESMLTKTEMAKSKLEDLCRELNKSSKEAQERNAQKFKLMEENHVLTVEKLKESLADIQKSVTAKHEVEKRAVDVEKLSDSLKELSTEYEKRLGDLKALYEDREESLESISKNKDAEVTILKTEMKNMHNKMHEVLQDNVNLKKELIANDSKMKDTLESEMQMRKLLNNYSEKYQNLLQNLARSNESFNKVKNEMKRMNSNLIRVEGDSRKWRTRVEEAEATINKVTAERVAAEKATALKDRQLAQLQELCRRLKSGGSGSPASEEPPATTSEASEAGETAPATSTVEADTNANSDEKPADTPTE